jgi:hypothetical protein
MSAAVDGYSLRNQALLIELRVPEALMELIRLSYRALESAGTGAPRGASDLREPSAAAQAQVAAACAAAARESNECVLLAKVGAGNLLHLLALGCSRLYTLRVAGDELALSGAYTSSFRPHTLVASGLISGRIH